MVTHFLGQYQRLLQTTAEVTLKSDWAGYKGGHG